MPEYLAPGVYVEEVPSGNQPIEGVSTSTSAFIGVTQRGPVNVPTLVTSFADFTRNFGDYLDHRVYVNNLDLLPYAVEGFFNNGGRRLFITRIIGTNATYATADLYGSPVLNPANTTLTERATAGATLLLINDGANISNGDTLLLFNGTRSEYVTAESDPVAVGVRLRGRLHGDQAATTAVSIREDTPTTAFPAAGDMAAGATSLNLTDPTGLASGDIVRVSDSGDPALTEYVTITTNDASDFDEAGGLLFDHPAATTEVTVVTMATAGDDPGGLQVDVDASAGDIMVQLSATTNIDEGDILQIGSEFHVVANVVSSLSIATTPTQNIHAADTQLIRQIPMLRIYARHQGSWGNNLRISIRPSSTLETEVVGDPDAGDSPITLAATFGLGEGSVINVTRGDPAAQILRQRVAGVDNNVNEVNFAAGGAGADLDNGDNVVSVEFDITISRLDSAGKEVESQTVAGLGMDQAHRRYAPDTIGTFDETAVAPSDTGEGALIRLVDLTTSDDDRLAIPFSGVTIALSGGNDDIAAIDDATFLGSPSPDPGGRTGIFTFENESDISLVAAPGQTSVDVQNALINHCELLRYRFAVLEVAAGAGLSQATRHRQQYDTTRAAVYYPWLTITDRFGRNGDVRQVPPSGHVTGVYARTDNTRGVHKAPANEVVRGIRELEVVVNNGTHELLNPNHVNVIRDFRENNRGIRIWGARTLSSVPEWKYVNVRRLFLFIERSIERGLQYAVFEPNAEPLWATVRRSITNFLISVWRDGALEGVTQEEAFFVNVGFGTTMTQDDIDNGRLIVVVGIAPVKPAEFVIIRISQKTREATG